MFKVIMGVVIGCAILALGGTALYKFDLLPFMHEENEPLLAKNVPMVEVPLNDILIPINIDRHQKLLLTNLSLFTDKTNKEEVEKLESKIKNKIIYEFSVKPEEYFTDKRFIANFQADLESVLVSEEEPNFKIKQVLVTKAVYQ